MQTPGVAVGRCFFRKTSDTLFNVIFSNIGGGGGGFFLIQYIEGHCLPCFISGNTPDLNTYYSNTFEFFFLLIYK